MRQRKTEKHRSRLTAHTNSVGEEVTGIRHESDQAAFNMRIACQLRVLKTKGAAKAKCHAKRHGDKEGEQEDPHSVKQG